MKQSGQRLHSCGDQSVNKEGQKGAGPVVTSNVWRSEQTAESTDSTNRYCLCMQCSHHRPPLIRQNTGITYVLICARK